MKTAFSVGYCFVLFHRWPLGSSPAAVACWGYRQHRAHQSSPGVMRHKSSQVANKGAGSLIWFRAFAKLSSWRLSCSNSKWFFNPAAVALPTWAAIMQLNPNPKFLVLAYPSEKTPTSQWIYVCIQGNSGNSWEDLELKSNMVVLFWSTCL